MTAIEKSRKSRLRACESVLIQHGKQWVAVGVALMEIRDNNLYKEDGYSSWAKYLAENEAQFGIGSVSQASDYIRGSSVMPALPKPTAPSGQSGWSIKHAVQLDRLPTNAKAATVAKSIMVNGKPPTVSVVKKAVDKVLGIVKPKTKPKPEKKEPPMFDEFVQRWTDELNAINVILAEISTEDLKLFRQSEPRVVKDLVAAVKRVDKSLEIIWAALPD